MHIHEHRHASVASDLNYWLSRVYWLAHWFRILQHLLVDLYCTLRVRFQNVAVRVLLVRVVTGRYLGPNIPYVLGWFPICLARAWYFTTYVLTVEWQMKGGGVVVHFCQLLDSVFWWCFLVLFLLWVCVMYVFFFLYRCAYVRVSLVLDGVVGSGFLWRYWSDSYWCL